MDMVKSNIESLRKLKIGIFIISISFMFVMFGNWMTFTIYSSILLCDILSLSSWYEFINVLRYAFGGFGVILFISPLIAIFTIQKQWEKIFRFNSIPKNKKNRDEILSEEHFKENINYISFAKIQESENFVWINGNLLDKSNIIDVKIGRKYFPTDIVVLTKNKKMIIHTNLEKNKLIDFAKYIKSLKKEKQENKTIKDSNSILILSIIISLVFLVFSNNQNLPLNDMGYGIVKLICIFCGIFITIIPKKIYVKLFGKKMKHPIIYSIFGLLPFYCYVGLSLAIQMLIKIQ